MADYQAQIRLGFQGLDKLQTLDGSLQNAANNADRLSGTKIKIRTTGAEALNKLASQMSAIETRAASLASAVSRIGGEAATIRFNARLDRQSLNKELDLVSRQFQRRNWRLNVTDTSVKTARNQAEKLREELEGITRKKYVINVEYKYSNPPSGGRSGGRPPGPPAPPRGPAGPGGASPEDIARRAGEAMASGLTGRLYSDAVAGARSSVAREGLIDRFRQRVQRPQSPGGINQALSQRYLQALGGAVPAGASPQELRAEVERLLRTVDESVIESITSRIEDLRLSLRMPRNMRPRTRAVSGLDELLSRMAEQTTRPEDAGRMLRMLPSRMITTDLAGLASQQASSYLWPSLIPQGKDRLFDEIRRLFGSYFKSLNPGSPWTGAGAKPYALQEIMAWEPWMNTPRSQRGQRMLPPARAGGAIALSGTSAAPVPASGYNRILPVSVRDITVSAMQSISRSVSGGGGASGGGGGGGGGASGGGGGGASGGIPRWRRQDSATVSDSRFASSTLYEGLALTSVDARRRGRFADVLDGYARAVVDGEQAQRSLNADIARTAQAIQSARRAYVEAGATQVLTSDQVRGTRSGITRQRRADFAIGQRRLADQIQALEESRAPIDIFRNYGRLQELYGGLPITQRRGALRGLRSARSGAIRGVASEALIGGAFPLLFGQGPATSIGGAIGGAASLLGPGAGFAGGLVGSAIGMQFDTFSNNLKELASSLKAPNDAIQALEKNGFNVGDSIKFQVQQLQSVGRAYDAQTLVLREVEKRLGPGAAKELNALNTEQKRLQESSAILAGDLQRLVIPGIIGFTVVLNDLVNFINKVRGGGQGVDKSRRNYRFNPLTGKLTDIGEAPRSRIQERIDKAIASASDRRALSPEDAFRDASSRIDESRKAADSIQSAYREAFKLQRQTHDLQRDGATLNREIADYSYKKEREIFDLRQQALEKQIENTRGATQNRIERGDLGARGAFSSAVGFEQQLLSNVREVMRTRKEGEADIEQSRRRLELTLVKLGRDAEDYKRTNAREIEDIERRKLAYTRSVEDYRMQVADYVLQRSRESADYMRQAMTLPDMGAGGSAPAGAGATGGGAMGSKLSRLIGSHESYGGNYGAFNRGGSNQGHTAHGSGIDPNLVNMTIAEIQRRQLAPGVPRNQQLHAVGKYQIIGSTLRSLMQGRYGTTGVGSGDRFTPEVQERLGSALARNRVQGRSVEQGMRGLRQEWIGLQYASDAKLREAVVELRGGAALAGPQASAATQVSNVPAPRFRGVPIGPTPSAAPSNAARMAAGASLAGGEKEAQRILEDQIKLRQKGVELGQIEQILQNNQLPQLQQQADALQRQIEARKQAIGLSDQAAAVADGQAEAAARLTQIEKDRVNALTRAKTQYNPQELVAATKQINEQAGLAVDIAKKEEEQRRKNIELNNQLQNQDRIRSEVLQLQETLAVEKAQAIALERGELKASNVELLLASTLYQQADEAQRQKLSGLVAETEELRKQNEFRRQINELQRDTSLVGAGIRAGFVGGGARAFEQGMRDFDGDTSKATDLANRTNLLESQKLVWENLEKNIVDVSNAISGSLTNGLVDIVSGTKKIEDVGREMLRNIAGSFADAAQQQLTSLLQRQLAGVLSGVVGGGGGGGGGSFASSLLGAAAPALIPGFSPSFAFGGFFANGGTTKPGEGYVVGEKGPEFFFPGMVGSVVPQSKVDKAAELRGMREPSEGVLDLRYTVKEERGERYVTESTFRKSNAALLQRARNSTYAGMRNSKDVRDYSGI